MTNVELDSKQLARLCRGNQEAMHWIQIGRQYVHEIDDLVDESNGEGKARLAERTCLIGALAIELYTHPFFVKHADRLSQAMFTNTCNYADSVRWEASTVEWQRHFSDWARHGWLDVCLTVAYICGGYENMRNESAELRTVSYVDHHDAEGKVT